MDTPVITDSIEKILDEYHVSIDGVRDAITARYRPRLAFATGSFVERRAGPTSDLDVRVVCCPSSEHPERDRSFFTEDLFWCGTTAMSTVDRRAVHIIFWPEDAVHAIRRKIDSTELASDSPMPVFTAEQVEFVEELQVSVPVIGPAELAELRESIDVEKFETIYFEALMARYDQCCGETEGPLLTGDVTMSAVRASRAVNAATDCYLYAHGRRVSKDKWRLRELLAVHDRDHEVVQRFLRYTLGGFEPGEDSELRKQVEERLAWCNELLLAVQT